MKAEQKSQHLLALVTAGNPTEVWERLLWILPSFSADHGCG